METICKTFEAERDKLVGTMSNSVVESAFETKSTFGKGPLTCLRNYVEE